MKSRRAKRKGLNKKKELKQTIIEHFFPRISADLGGAEDPIVLKKRLKKNESHIIIDKLNKEVIGGYSFEKLPEALRKKGVALIQHEIKEGSQLPLRTNSINHIDCREVYDGGEIINPRIVAREAKRVLKNKGTITVSGRAEDKEEVVKSFLREGFTIEGELKKPVTKFEKSDEYVKPGIKRLEREIKEIKKLEKERKIDEANAELIIKMKEDEIKELKKKKTGIFMIKFRKAD